MKTEGIVVIFCLALIVHDAAANMAGETWAKIKAKSREIIRDIAHGLGYGDNEHPAPKQYELGTLQTNKIQNIGTPGTQTHGDQPGKPNREPASPAIKDARTPFPDELTEKSDNRYGFSKWNPKSETPAAQPKSVPNAVNVPEQQRGHDELNERDTYFKGFLKSISRGLGYGDNDKPDNNKKNQPSRPQSESVKTQGSAIISNEHIRFEYNSAPQHPAKSQLDFGKTAESGIHPNKSSHIKTFECVLGVAKLSAEQNNWIEIWIKTEPLLESCIENLKNCPTTTPYYKCEMDEYDRFLQIIAKLLLRNDLKLEICKELRQEMQKECEYPQKNFA